MGSKFSTLSMDFIDGKISTVPMPTIFDQSAGSIVTKAGGIFFLSMVVLGIVSAVSAISRKTSKIETDIDMS